MMNSWLLQQGSGNCQKMLELTSPWHRLQCHNHNINYVPRFSRVDPYPFSDSSENQVALVRALRGEIAHIPIQSGDFLAILDADAIWKYGDIRNALPDGYDMALFTGDGFVNSGFVALRATNAVLDFWNEVLSLGPVRENNLLIDVRISERLFRKDCPLKVYSLLSEWNWFDSNGPFEFKPSCPRENAHIIHWQSRHKSEALEEMKQELCEAAL